MATNHNYQSLPSFYSQTEPPDFVHRPQLFSLCLQPDQVTRLCPQTTTTSLSSLFPQPDQATRLCPQTTLSSIFAVARANYEPVSINHNPLSSFFPTARTKSSVSIHKPQFSALLLSSLQPGHITARCQQTTTPSPSAPVFSTSGEGFHWDRWDYSCVRLRERVRRDVCKRKQTMEQKQRSCPIPQSSCSISPELLLHVRRAANRKLITGPCATLSASPSSASSWPAQTAYPPPPPHSTPTRPIVALRPVWRVSASQQALSDVPVYTHTPVTLHCGQFTSLDSTTRPAEKSKKGKFHWLHPVIAGNEIRVGCPRNTESCHCLFVWSH